TVPLRAEASDADGLVDTVEFFVNGSSVGFGRRSRDSATAFQLDWANAQAGSYVVTARATDGLGLSTISSGVHFAVRTDEPPPPNPERELHVVGLAGGVASNGVPPSNHGQGH